MIKHVTLKAAAVALSMSLFSGVAWSALSIDKAMVYFNDKSGERQDVEIINSGDSNLYLDIEVKEVVNPGLDDEARVPIKDKLNPDFLVTPNKVIVPPKGTKTLRMVNLNEGLQQDRVYRISVTPVVAGVESETSGVKILVAYEVLAIAQPENPGHNVGFRMEQGEAVFQNSGNTSALLLKGKQCPDGETDENCYSLPSKRIYPGAEWRVELPYSTPVEVQVLSGQGNELQTFTP